MTSGSDALRDTVEADATEARVDFALARSPHVDVALARRGPVVGFGQRGGSDSIVALAEGAGWSLLGIGTDGPRTLRSDPVAGFSDAHSRTSCRRQSPAGSSSAPFFRILRAHRGQARYLRDLAD